MRPKYTAKTRVAWYYADNGACYLRMPDPIPDPIPMAQVVDMSLDARRARLQKISAAKEMSFWEEWIAQEGSQ